MLEGILQKHRQTIVIQYLDKYDGGFDLGGEWVEPYPEGWHCFILLPGEEKGVCVFGAKTPTEAAVKANVKYRDKIKSLEEKALRG